MLTILSLLFARRPRPARYVPRPRNLSTSGYDMRTGERYTVQVQVVARGSNGRVRASHTLHGKKGGC